MKIKRDFVTNSSSSSFIVAFPPGKISLDYLREKIFSSGSVSRDQKAETVLKDITHQKGIELIKDDCNIISKIGSIIDEGWFEGGINLWDHHDKKAIEYGFKDHYDLRKNASQEIQDKIYRDYQLQNQQICDSLAENFIKENEGMVVYIFEYADEDGSYFSEMEHGGTFKNFPNIKISKH